MKSHNFNYFGFVVFIALLFCLTSAVTAQAAAFTGKMVEVKNGKTSFSKVFFQAPTYRMDIKDGENTMTVLVNRQTGKTYVLDHQKKSYIETANDSLPSLANNPFESHLHMTRIYPVTDAGVEEVNGVACEKQVIGIGGKQAATAWVSKTYAFPLKIINHINGYTVEIKGLQDLPSLPAVFFNIPNDYTRAASPESQVAEKKTTAEKKAHAAMQAGEKQVAPAQQRQAVKNTVPAGSVAPTSSLPVAKDVALNRTDSAGPETVADSSQTELLRDDSGGMILVLDASGSMWGRLEGRPKIVIAKEVMAELIDEIPRNFRTGLTVYGHRRKGDCDDIETLVAPGPHNPVEMKKRIQAISPKGKTPLSESVRQAAEALKYTEEKATVVLVSDGLETCHMDPCKLAATLVATGVDFAVHVIGFDISKGDQERLRCLADKTGGLFLTADNAGSLREALFETVEKIEAPPAAVVEDPGEAVLSAPVTVPAGSPFKVDWQGPGSKGDYINLSREESDDSSRWDYRYTRTGNPLDFRAPGETGMYELRYIHRHSRKIIGRTGIEVTPVQASLEAPPSVNAASRFDVAWHGPGYAGDFISIARPDDPGGRYLFYTYVNTGNPLELRAPADPGSYELRYVIARDDTIVARQGIVIAPTEATVQAPETSPVASLIEIAWTGPDNKGDYISIARPDQSGGHYINYTTTNHGSPLEVRAPSEAGTYEIRYVQDLGDKMLAVTSIEITPVTATVQAPEQAAAGSLFEAVWSGPDIKGDYVSIARPDQPAGKYINYTTTNHGSPLAIRAPPDPGPYKVRYILGRGNKLLAETDIEITPVTASVRVPEYAAAGSQLEVGWDGPGYKGDYISLARPDQQDRKYLYYSNTNTGNPLKLQAPPESGTYEVRYILGIGRRLLAKTAIRIDPVTASLDGPDSAAAGSRIEVAWQGPGYKRDFISIALPDQKSGRYKTYTTINRNNPVTLKIPKQQGTYEIRYIMGLNHTLLARKPLTVTP